MSDKDLLVVISEMLRKQDRQAEILNLHSQLLEKQSEILNSHSGMLEKQNEILNSHSGMLEKQNQVLETVSATLSSFMDVSIRQFDQQQAFNERFINKLDSIEKLLVRVVDMEERIKRLEAAVFK